MSNFLPDAIVPLLPVFAVAGVLLFGVLWLFVVQPKFEKKKTSQGASAVEKQIFISYRRVESADIVGRLYDRLKEEFGGAVFKDVDSIPLGVDFRTYVEEALTTTKVFLAVIGPTWTESFASRAFENDFVYIEIGVALEMDIPILPVLVRGASMPSPDQIPDSIQEVCFRNAAQLRPDPDFNNDIARVIETVSALRSS